MPLTRLFYYSENLMSSARLLTDLRDLLAVSRRNNEVNNISGALVCDNLWFLQALEGDRSKVWETLKRIEADERHANIVIIDARTIDARFFGNWWMGLATFSEETAVAFSPFLRNGQLQPHLMTVDNVMQLMTSIAKLGLSRKLTDPGARGDANDARA